MDWRTTFLLVNGRPRWLLYVRSLQEVADAVELEWGGTLPFTDVDSVIMSVAGRNCGTLACPDADGVALSVTNQRVRWSACTDRQFGRVNHVSTDSCS